MHFAARINAHYTLGYVLLYVTAKGTHSIFYLEFRVFGAITCTTGADGIIVVAREVFVIYTVLQCLKSEKIDICPR